MLACLAQILILSSGYQSPSRSNIKETIFEKTNTFNLLLNDINKAQPEPKYKLICTEGTWLRPPARDNLLLRREKGTLGKTINVNLFYLHTCTMLAASFFGLNIIKNTGKSAFLRGAQDVLREYRRLLRAKICEQEANLQLRIVPDSVRCRIISGTIPESLPGSVFSPSERLQLLSSSERPVSRKRSAGRWSSRTGRPRRRRRPGWGRTWRTARTPAARRSGPCRRSPSGTGKSDLRGWTPRPTLRG